MFVKDLIQVLMEKRNEQIQRCVYDNIDFREPEISVDVFYNDNRQRFVYHGVSDEITIVRNPETNNFVISAFAELKE